MNRLFEKICNSWKVIRVLLSLAVFTGLLVFVVKEFMPSRDTYGSIYVDSPEVYTRERLVNDRFLQDAWLNGWLKLKDKNREFVGNKSYLDVLNSIKASLEKTEKNKDAESPEDSTQSNSVSLSTGDVFVDMVDFRDRVRNLKIENQLDDRHDLKGNTLYRLKFDATIVPGNSTRALAKIEVKLKGPDCLDKDKKSSANTVLATQKNLLKKETSSECLPSALKDLGSNEKIEKIDKFRKVYERWLLNLQARFNRTHREQKQAYYNNEFKIADYNRLKDYFKTYRNIELSTLDKCKCCAGDFSPERQNGNSEKSNRYSINDLDHSAARACIRCIVGCILKKERKERKERAKAAAKAAEAATINQDQNQSQHGKYPIGDQSAPKENTETVEDGKKNQDQINAQYGEYTTAGPLAPITELKAPPTELQISEELEKHLNSFLASKTIQLVLGIKIPQSKFQKNDLYLLEQLQPLSKISFFSSQMEETGYKVFTVQERNYSITAINKKTITEKSFLKDKLKDFDQPIDNGSQDTAESKNLHITTNDYSFLRDESYPVDSCEFKEDPSYPGEYNANLEVGLRNFVNHATDQTKPYAYAVTPKMRSQNLFSTLQRSSEAGGTVPWLESAQVRLGRDVVTRTVNRKGTTVGFAKGSEENEAVFGWVIGPRFSVANSKEKVHSPRQQSLAALISLPSWWNKVQLTVTTQWLDRDGKAIEGQSHENPPTSYELELPANYEQLEADMLQLQQLGPELMESMLDPIRLTACKGGAIVIPGRRLWRSTVVTLGYQTADEISVLPNMKGIIARFDNVINQASVAEVKRMQEDGNKSNRFEIRRAVRVWTSQGTIGLPEQARIGIPKSCREARAVETSKKNGE